MYIKSKVSANIYSAKNCWIFLNNNSKHHRNVANILLFPRRNNTWPFLVATCLSGKYFHVAKGEAGGEAHDFVIAKYGGKILTSVVLYCT